MTENKFGLPGLDYFEWKNCFTGSLGQSFRYRVLPEGETMKVFVWRKDLCFEKCQVEAEAAFALSQDGLTELDRWLQSQYQS